MHEVDHSSPLAPLPRSADFDVDPSTFSAPNWLNQVLSSPSPPELTTLHELLSDALRDSHESLDTSLHEALKAVPWVVRESDRVRQRTNLLRSEIDQVGKRVAGVETGVASSVKTIADADTVVRRVQKAASLLETASNADLLLERLESLLASAGVDGSDLVSAADVASQLRKALIPLKDVGELGDRFKLLDQADKRLENLATPQLRKALDERNAQAVINARIVFDHAGRENAFRAQYVTLRGNQVIQLWSDTWIAQQQQLQQQRAEAAVAAAAAVSEGDTAEKINVSTTATSTAGEFAAEASDVALRVFYDALTALVVAETNWLRDVFPDVKAMLLPALLCDSLGALKEPSPRANVFIHPSVTDAVGAADAIADSLFSVGQISIIAAARIATTLMPSHEEEEDRMNGDEKRKDVALEIQPSATDEENGNGMRLEKKITRNEKEDKEDSTIVDAVSALLMPYRMFWDALLQIAVRQGRTRADAIQMTYSRNTVGRPALEDVAKDVETCTREACTALDIVIGSVTARSCGVGIIAMKQAAATLCSVISDRLNKLLSSNMNRNTRNTRINEGSEDEWTRLGGALRLLMAASGLKRAWDTRKESALAVAIGSATPMLELANVVKMNGGNNTMNVGARGSKGIARVKQFLTQVDSGLKAEAGIVWELVRDESLSQRVVVEFETIGSGRGDFEKVVQNVHRVVYDTMFSGVISRFESFSSHDLWTAAGSTRGGGSAGATGMTTDMSNSNADTEMAMSGLSNSPLRYATEVADYLMAIPQQLEPFVPDEEDAKHATPTSVWQFCNTAVVPVADGGGGGEGAEGTGEEEDGDEGMSFAGMWISVLAMGTMDLYVEKICSVTRLSEAGAKQLATDADYLCNVMASLGVTPTQDMALVCKLLECKKDASSFSEAASGFESAQHRKLIRRVAAVRGVNVTL